jgi:hypothetical protein
MICASVNLLFFTSVSFRMTDSHSNQGIRKGAGQSVAKKERAGKQRITICGYESSEGLSYEFMTMAQNRLELRSLPAVAAAYIIAPVAGGLTLEATFAGKAMLQRAFGQELQRVLVAVLWVAMPALVIEILFITPLLIGYRKYRWPWLNGWVAAGVGFVFATLLGVFVVVSSSNGPLTFLSVAQRALAFAPVGIACALTFRLVAVRVKVNEPPAGRA